MISSFAPVAAMISAACKRGVVAGVVEQQHVRRRLHVARQNVPSRGDEVVSISENFGMRQPAGGDDRDVGIFAENVARLGPNVETELDATRSALRHPPIDDPHHLASPRAQRGQTHLSARLARGLEHHDLVPALGRDARGLQAGGPGADDHDFAPLVGARDLVRHRQFASGGGVVQAKGLAALVDAVEAIIGADAGADLVLAAFA